MVKGKVGIIIILYPWQAVVVIAQLIGMALEKRERGAVQRGGGGGVPHQSLTNPYPSL